MAKQTQFMIWNEQAIEQLAKHIQAGEVVAFPTETVYGLGADASNPAAVDKIFIAKGRPADNPLIVHVADKEQIEHYVTDIPEYAKKLIDSFMPGPLTVVLPSNGKIADNVTPGMSSVGIRIPAHPAAQELIREANLPIAAPSANLSGKPSPTSAIHVFQDLNGKIAAILDGGTTGVGLESTVVDCTGISPKIIRPGGVTQAEIELVLDCPVEDSTTDLDIDKPKAPGMKYNHYQPDVPMILIEGNQDFFQSKINQLQAEGKKVGLLVSEELASNLSADQLQICGTVTNLSTIASQLYQVLRAFKKTDVDIVLAEVFPAEGVGKAIMNRLKKAADYIEKAENDR
ncbi:L-threonylcarbamoyladenylate synthase [Amphibacillus sp. Q70]|uniref:L-threonylcarbamoyladenylate synthase n=1 Tax=Amphibacillus sp. Q70 TaxID=3453416 RepID=UPI003F85BE0E